MPPPAADPLPCPGCGVTLAAELTPEALLHRCPACGGAWLDPGTFRALALDEARRAPPSQPSLPRSTPVPPEPVRYRRCPACGEPMARVNFGHVSGVVIDTCRAHGAFFDRGELDRIRRFLRQGGLRGAARHRVVRDELRRSFALRRLRRSRPLLLRRWPPPTPDLDVLVGRPRGSPLRRLAVALAILAVAVLLGLDAIARPGPSWRSGAGEAAGAAVLGLWGLDRLLDAIEAWSWERAARAERAGAGRAESR